MLDELRRLAAALATEYGWHPAQASTFVVTGVTPIASPVRIVFPVWTSAVAPTLTMELSVVASSGEVLLAYSAALREMGISRGRGLSAKHARLGAFVAERPDGEPRSESMRLWNDAHPRRWHYSDRRRFGKEAREALHSVSRGLALETRA